VSRFSSINSKDFTQNPLKFLYAGQIVQHKGVHTTIEAAAKLLREFEVNQFHLTLVGSGHPEYESYLRSLVIRNNLQNYVTFNGPVPKDEMPSVLRKSDVLILPSIYEEPFARMTQEAMLAGLVVVGTTTGGTKEILFEDKTGLTFPKGDDYQLTRQLYRLTEDRGLCRRLSQAGRKTVLENFTLEMMVDKIENYLQEITA
jgi:glycosyltransferase involved in cell wall biosynthesis